MVRELLRIMGITSKYTTSYHPSCNGLTERFNKTLADMISIYTNTNQTDWDVYIPHCVWAYNTSKQATTKYTPFELVYARYPVLPTEANLLEETKVKEVEEIRQRALAVRNIAVENIKNKQKLDKKRYDEKHRHIEFSPGDQVKVFVPIRKVGRSEKLLLRWFGPYYVIRKIGEVDYEIRKGRSEKAKTDIIHVSRILPYNDPWTPTPEENTEIENVNNNENIAYVGENIKDNKDKGRNENNPVNGRKHINNIIEVGTRRAHTLLSNRELEVELVLFTKGENIRGKMLNNFEFKSCYEIQGENKWFVPSSHPYVREDRWYIKVWSRVDYPVEIVTGTVLGFLYDTGDPDNQNDEYYISVDNEEEEILFPEKCRKLEFKAGDKVKVLVLQEEESARNKIMLRWVEGYKIIECVEKDIYAIEGPRQGEPILVHSSDLLPCNKM